MADPEEAGEEYADVLGVITALERTCELESRLRQCIQDTHPLTTTLDWDFEAADREREGLLAIRCAGVRPPGRCAAAAGDVDSRSFDAFCGAACSCRPLCRARVPAAASALAIWPRQKPS